MDNLMAKAKKLPSGSWRCLVYSHTERIWDEKKQIWKDKRIYESFTSDDPSPAGKREAEFAAAQFALNKHAVKAPNGYTTLKEAIDKYIESSDAVLSPSTIRGYRTAQKNSFQGIMNMKLKSLST